MSDELPACRGFWLWATQEAFDKLEACRTFSVGGNVMKVGFLSLALIVVGFAGAPGNLASATRIAFAQTQQSRNQTQTQEGLSPAPQRQPVTSAGAPSAQPSAAPVQSPTAEPSPTAAAGSLENGLQSPPL